MTAEELRKRHLFFRDIDGRPSLDFALAIKRYQQRQGFAQTGVADEMTLYSLGIGEPAPPAEGATAIEPARIHTALLTAMAIPTLVLFAFWTPLVNYVNASLIEWVPVASLP